MLHHGCSIGTVWSEYLATSVDIVEFSEFLLILIKILGIGNFLLEGLHRETSQEVLFSHWVWSWWGTVVQVLEFRTTDQLVTTIGLEDSRMRD